MTLAGTRPSSGGHRDRAHAAPRDEPEDHGRDGEDRADQVRGQVEAERDDQCDHRPIGRWWETLGSATYPGARRRLVTADAGGSNGYRLRLWKVELGRLAVRTGLAITVCHLPPGTSKWNKIEHRLFSAITMNWRGRPLTSHEVVVNLIGATTNRGGLKVHAHRDTGSYPHGIKVADVELAAVPVITHEFHGDWNYTVLPNERRQCRQSASANVTRGGQAELK